MWAESAGMRMVGLVLASYFRFHSRMEEVAVEAETTKSLKRSTQVTGASAPHRESNSAPVVTDHTCERITVFSE